jgi:hypothetical protein
MKMTTTSVECLTRNLGAFEHLIWLIDQFSPRHFLLVARIEGSSIAADSVRRALRERSSPIGPISPPLSNCQHAASPGICVSVAICKRLPCKALRPEHDDAFSSK